MDTVSPCRYLKVPRTSRRESVNCTCIGELGRNGTGGYMFRIERAGCLAFRVLDFNLRDRYYAWDAGNPWERHSGGNSDQDYKGQGGHEFEAWARSGVRHGVNRCQVLRILRFLK